MAKSEIEWNYLMLPYREHRTLYLLLLASLVLRGIAAACLELGNDEVYYRTYALYPDWSHFDHPPVIGYLIRIFTFNLLFDHEFFYRLASLVTGTVSTYLIYLIGLRFGNKRMAIISSFLFTGSIYCCIISGLFVMPDAPLLPLWLAALYFSMQIVASKEIDRQGKRALLFTGLFIGLAMISKYHAFFLWTGILFYFLLYDRKWFRTRELYLAMLISLICLLPVLLWNWQNDFISFRFQGSRVNFFENGIRPDLFATELLGQVFYNNPFNFVLIIISLVSVFKGRMLMNTPLQRLIVLISLPLIVSILFFSIFRKTLPHWSGPAYLTLLPLVAAYVAGEYRKFSMKLVSGSVSLLFFVLAVGTVEVNYGILTDTFGKKSDVMHKRGKHDITLDMYGWKQFAVQFRELTRNDIKNHNFQEDAPIVAHRWFTAAHLDYYVASPLGKKLLAFGDLDAIHKFAWINLERGLPAPHSDAYYITNSREYAGVETVRPYFESAVSADTIPIYRLGTVVEYFFVYRLKNYRSDFPNPLPENSHLQQPSQ